MKPLAGSARVPVVVTHCQPQYSKLGLTTTVSPAGMSLSRAIVDEK